MATKRGSAPPWISKAKDWKANHFSIADSRGNVPRLLRKVARSIGELGAISILDITFVNEAGWPYDKCQMTVYYVRDPVKSAVRRPPAVQPERK